MNSYKHSGAFGDLIYSLALVKHLGAGKFYLHLDQINWVGKFYYGSNPDPIHQNRLNQQDFEFMKSFMLSQDYIKSFSILDQSAEVTHNLDRFRPLFVGHPGNYVDVYSSAFGINDIELRKTIRNSPWLTVPQKRRASERSIVINRTARWLPPQISNQWNQWKSQGWEERSVFVGLESEYQNFIKNIGWNIPYQPTQTMLELAEYIAGSETFIGNQSMALALSIGLGQKFYCEYRRDLPLERNECYFPKLENGNYF